MSRDSEIAMARESAIANSNRFNASGKDNDHSLSRSFFGISSSYLKRNGLEKQRFMLYIIGITQTELSRSIINNY